MAASFIKVLLRSHDHALPQEGGGRPRRLRPQRTGVRRTPFKSSSRAKEKLFYSFFCQSNFLLNKILTFGFDPHFSSQVGRKERIKTEC